MKDISSHKKALAAVATISILWGTTWLPSKLSVSTYHMPPLQICGLRQTIAGIFFLSYFLLNGYKIPPLKKLAKLFVLSLFFLVFSNGLTVMALAHPSISSGVGAVISATVPLWMALMSIIILRKQKFSTQVIAGLILGFGGIILIFADDLAVFFDLRFLQPVGLLILACISWSLGSLLNARKDETINPFYSLGLQMLMSGLVLLLFSYGSEKTVALPDISYPVWLCLAYLIIIGSGFSFISYIFALKHLPATQVATYAYINPIIALFLGYMLHQEHTSWYVVLGSLVTLLGVYLVNRSFERKVI